MKKVSRNQAISFSIRRSRFGLTGVAALIVAGTSVFGAEVNRPTPRLAREGAASAPAAALRDTFDQGLAQFDEAQRVLAEEPERARQLFRLAAQTFQSLRAAGIENGRIEYNTGNCYLQAGDVGRAILHYRRAQRLVPRDPLLTENLTVARSRCLTCVPPTRASRLLGSLFWWHFQTSHASRAKTAIMLYVFFWLLLATSLATRRKPAYIATAAAAILALALAASLASDAWALRHAPPAVVVGMDVPVYKGPASTYQRQFEQPLQAGTECIVRERRGEWSRIELPDGHGGWILSTHCELVEAPLG